MTMEKRITYSYLVPSGVRRRRRLSRAERKRARLRPSMQRVSVVRQWIDIVTAGAGGAGGTGTGKVSGAGGEAVSVVVGSDGPGLDCRVELHGDSERGVYVQPGVHAARRLHLVLVPDARPREIRSAINRARFGIVVPRRGPPPPEVQHMRFFGPGHGHDGGRGEVHVFTYA